MRDLHNNIRGRYDTPGKESIHDETFGIMDRMPTHPTHGWPGDEENKDGQEVNDSYSPDILEIDIVEIDILPADENMESVETETEPAAFCDR